jgi:hypothetical protein
MRQFRYAQVLTLHGSDGRALRTDKAHGQPGWSALAGKRF